MAAKNTTTTRGALGTDPKQLSQADFMKKYPGVTHPGHAYATYQRTGKTPQVASQTPSAQAPGAQQPPQASYQDVTNSYNNALNSTLGQIGQQQPYQPPKPVGEFNPGDFSQTQDKAYNSVMDRYNRSMQPQFDKQESDWQQMAAERGWDPTSKAAADAHKMQVSDPQNTARQNAMDSAYGQGLQAQNQGFQQASNTWGNNAQAQNQNFTQGVAGQMMPYNQLQYLDPAFRFQTGYQMQNSQEDWQGQQNANSFEQQKYLQAHQKGGGGGNGAPSLADQMALQNNQFYNGLALLNAQGQPLQPNPVNGAINGGVQGATGAIIGSLMK